MYPLGHVGITMATAIGIIALLDRQYERTEGARGCGPRRGISASRHGALMGRVDLRFVVVGSMLADIIDKAVGHVLLADSLDNGRLVGHTLLFCLAFIAIGSGMQTFGSRGRVNGADPRRWADLHVNVVALGLAGMVHLALDMMWLYPETLLWPGLGWGFPEEDFQFGDWLVILATDPIVQVGEAVGAMILVAIALRYGLLRKGAMRRFIATGRLA